MNVYFGSNGKCGVLSPDGALGCVKKVGHESAACANTYRGVQWCDDCMMWTCQHVGPSEVPQAFKDALDDE